MAIVHRVASAELNKGISICACHTAGRALCVPVVRRVPLSAVMRLFASFPCIPRRRTQLRLVRAMVYVLALALVWANTAAAAMPIPAANQGSAHAMATQSQDGDHCQGPSSHKQAKPSHGQGCPCCDGKSCACAHVCGDVTMLAPLAASIVVSTHVSSVLPSRDYATVSAPLLRPPIA
jgi:hypothetical protein